jgi:hypothetical protein
LFEIASSPEVNALDVPEPLHASTHEPLLTPATALDTAVETKASVARSAVVSPAVCVVAVVPFGSAGVPLRLAAVPVVFWLNVGKLVMFAALIVGAVWKDGAAVPPVAGPANTEF